MLTRNALQMGDVDAAALFVPVRLDQTTRSTHGR